MYKQRWSAGALVVIALSISTVWSASLGIMVPAYFYPSAGSDWNKLNSAAAHIPLIAIMNPASGPGKSRDKTYVRALSKLHHAGGKVIGYVHTSYGDRPLAEVENEIDRYRAFYAVDGFFIDEMTNDKNMNHLDYYAAIYKYVKAKGANYTVTGNPGCNTTEDYMTRLDGRQFHDLRGQQHQLCQLYALPLGSQIFRTAICASALQRGDGDDHDELCGTRREPPCGLDLHYRRHAAQPVQGAAVLLGQ